MNMFWEHVSSFSRCQGVELGGFPIQYIPMYPRLDASTYARIDSKDVSAIAPNDANANSKTDAGTNTRACTSVRTYARLVPENVSEKIEQVCVCVLSSEDKCRRMSEQIHKCMSEQKSDQMSGCVRPYQGKCHNLCQTG